MGELTGKVAIVTGAASGIGRASAIALARDGATVVVADIDLPGAEVVAAQIRSAGGEALVSHTDVSDEDAVVQMIELACRELGGLDVLHNNVALTSHPGAVDRDLVSMDTEFWDLVMNTNVRTVMLGCKHGVPRMIERGGGSIINTASAMGLTGAASQPAYGTSKGAMITLTKYVATLHGKQGIRCNAVAPGVIDTPALRSSCPPWLVDIFAQSTLLPRIGTPDDVADAVVFLASDRSSFITGQTLCVDGGFLAHVPQYAQLSNLAPPP